MREWVNQSKDQDCYIVTNFPQCLFLCLLQIFLPPIYFPHCTHLNFDIPSCFLILCLLNYNLPPIYFPQCPHLNFDIPTCFLILCILNYNLSPIYFPHISHLLRFAASCLPQSGCSIHFSYNLYPYIYYTFIVPSSVFSLHMIIQISFY